MRGIMTEEVLKSQDGQDIQDTIETSPYEIAELWNQEPPALDLKAERKFCSGIGMNYFIFFLVAYVCQLGMAFLLLACATELVVNNFAIYMILVMAPIYAVAFPVLAALSKRRPAVKLERHKMRGGDFMILLMMCFGVMVVGNFIGIFVNFVIGAIKGSPIMNSIDTMMQESSLWANILIVGICAPIFEELIFRKLLVDRMVRYGEAVAVVVSGLMFGLFHGNFSQFFYAAFLGFLFAYVYVKTGNVKYTIVLHMIINLSSTLMVPVLAGLDMTKLANLEQQLLQAGSSPEMLAGAMGDIMQVLPYLIILLVYEFVLYGMAIAGIVLLILRRKRFTFKAGEITLPKGSKASVVWGNAGMILFTLACLAMFVYAVV